MRRTAGEAAELIRSALTATGAPALTLAQLQERTGLANATIHDNIKRLCKSGEVRTSEDGHGTLWVGMHNNLW